MNSSATTRIDVVASSGQLLSSRSVVGSYELDLSGLNDGLYLVRASNSSEVLTQRATTTSR
ncbi:MAG: T9SS type A sorting domain-containing protein [Flavobacteriales bacterium]|nr:T9SS type A sorting domain-containing protein [Flavobacteriales bacterium]